MTETGPVHGGATQRSLGEDGVVRANAFELPLSSFLGSDSRAALLGWLQFQERMAAQAQSAPPGDEGIVALRAYFARNYFPDLIAACRARYSVEISRAEVAGVETEIFVPEGDVKRELQERVLINLHGGDFMFGNRDAGRLESIPIAALTGIKVISVDYRMAPEYRYPAATDDVLGVYRALLRTHEPTRIAIYGCSAGALLTAQAIAALRARDLPRPAAAGLFCAGGSFWSEGDSGHIGTVVSGAPFRRSCDHRYLESADSDDPAAFPTRSDTVLREFPPSLLISGTRDHCLSSVVHMHSRLTVLGIAAQLNIWEGLGHAFFYDPALPESHEAHRVIARFLLSRLGHN